MLMLIGSRGRRGGFLLAFVAAVCVGVVPSAGAAPLNPGDARNCADFATQPDAQDWFDFYFPYYGDVAELDRDNDGIACEHLPPDSPPPGPGSGFQAACRLGPQTEVRTGIVTPYPPSGSCS